MHSLVLSLHGSNLNKINWKMLFQIRDNNELPNRSTQHRIDMTMGKTIVNIS